ncbi:MAG: CarD family transcriptional regulator, partial [Acidimicrobiia bacterium]
MAALAAAGYHRTGRVELRGEFAVRGGIVDVYPAQTADPVRLDFWGDTIEDARLFSVSTQRSTEQVAELVAYPAREFRGDQTVVARVRELAAEEPWAAATWDRFIDGTGFAGMESWMPWFAPPRTAVGEIAEQVQVVLFDPSRAGDRSRDLTKEESELAATLAPTWGRGAPEAGEHPGLYLSLDDELNGVPVLDAPPVAARPGDEALEVRGLDAVPGDAESVTGALGRLRGEGVQVVVAMDGVHAADRVARVLRESGLDLPRRERLKGTESIVLSQGVHSGFVAPALGVAVLGEREVAGRRRAHRQPSAPSRGEARATYRDLNPGDHVVHHRHGIGRFDGLVSQALAGAERDYLLISYAGADRLYVPTDQLAAV